MTQKRYIYRDCQLRAVITFCSFLLPLNKWLADHVVKFSRMRVFAELLTCTSGEILLEGVPPVVMGDPMRSRLHHIATWWWMTNDKISGFFNMNLTLKSLVHSEHTNQVQCWESTQYPGLVSHPNVLVVWLHAFSDWPFFRQLHSRFLPVGCGAPQWSSNEINLSTKHGSNKGRVIGQSAAQSFSGSCSNW